MEIPFAHKNLIFAVLTFEIEYTTIFLSIFIGEISMKLPALLKLNDGRWVENGEDWRVRRQEILDILRREEYGY